MNKLSFSITTDEDPRIIRELIDRADDRTYLVHYLANLLMSGSQETKIKLATKREVILVPIMPTAPRSLFDDVEDVSEEETEEEEAEEVYAS